MNLVAISPGPIDPDMRPGYYLRHVGYGIEVIVVGPMPNTPEDFEIELARRFGTRYEITHAAGVGAPDGIDESQFYRRGFWRMSFYPSNRIRHGDAPETRTEARPPRRRRTPAQDARNGDIHIRALHDVLTNRHRVDWSTEPNPDRPVLHVGVDMAEEPRPRTTGQIDTLARRFLVAEREFPPPLTPSDQILFDARVRVLRQERAEPSHTVRVISRGDVRLPDGEVVDVNTLRNDPVRFIQLARSYRYDD